MLGETEYRHQVESDMLPFRDILLGIFFVTIPLVEMPAPDFIMQAECDLIDFIGCRRTWSATQRFQKKSDEAVH